MISKKDLNSAELETVTTSRSPTTVITSNGEVQTHEEPHSLCQRIGYILDNESPRGYAISFITGKALRWTPILMWVDQQSKNHISLKTVFEYSVIRKNFVPIVVPGLSTSSSSSLPTSPPHDTFKAGNWSFQVFLKLVYLNTYDICNGDWSFRSPSRNRVKWTCGKASTVRPVFFWNIRRIVD